MRIKINIAICFLLSGFAACTAHKKLIKTADTVTNEKEKVVVVNNIEQYATTYLLKDSNLLSAHVGISVYDPSEKKYLYNYQGNKYFIPASNTKLLTCYAAMKYLGDSLVGLRYELINDTSISIRPTADPTFLISDFTNQPVYDFLKKFKSIEISPKVQNFKYQGKGWAWDDYGESYAALRGEFPIYGNLATFELTKDSTIKVIPKIFEIHGITGKTLIAHGIEVIRMWDSNYYSVIGGKNKNIQVPFVPHISSVRDLLNDTLNISTKLELMFPHGKDYRNIIHSQPTDSLLKITMHRSDNFFAEQTLLMVSNERFGVMSDEKIIDTLSKTDYKSMPQRPKWVDGSGLSRYNLISPQDFVFVLEKMKNEFVWNRITTILPTGDEGTLKGLYKNYAGKIYAKTGTVSNNLALSGYIITNKNKQLIFSVMVNNHQASASAIRRSIEKFITAIIENY